MPKTIGFYSTKGPAGFCSNFYRAPIFLQGREWKTSEHYYQAQKARWPADYENIWAAPTPKEAARIGRSIEIWGDWDKNKYAVMQEAVRAKFKQNKDLAEKLLATEDAYLVEDTIGSPRSDAVWGNGVAGEGSNWLGIILMEVRDELAAERRAKPEEL